MPEDTKLELINCLKWIQDNTVLAPEADADTQTHLEAWEDAYTFLGILQNPDKTPLGNCAKCGTPTPGKNSRHPVDRALIFPEIKDVLGDNYVKPVEEGVTCHTCFAEIQKEAKADAEEFKDEQRAKAEAEAEAEKNRPAPVGACEHGTTTFFIPDTDEVDEERHKQIEAMDRMMMIEAGLATPDQVAETQEFVDTNRLYFDTYAPLPDGAKEWRKTATIHAVQMDKAFRVLTLEGEVSGDHGDWLAKGVSGELYPINEDVFAQTYVQTHDGPGCPACGLEPPLHLTEDMAKDMAQFIIKGEQARKELTRREQIRKELAAEAVILEEEKTLSQFVEEKKYPEFKPSPPIETPSLAKGDKYGPLEERRYHSVDRCGHCYYFHNPSERLDPCKEDFADDEVYPKRMACKLFKKAEILHEGGNPIPLGADPDDPEYD